MPCGCSCELELPDRLSAQVSADDADWRAPVAEGQGSPGTTVIAFAPKTAKFVRCSCRPRWLRGSKRAIAIMQEIAGRAILRKGVPKLLGGPCCGGCSVTAT